MTIEEKRSFLIEFCNNRSCSKCPLFVVGVMHGDFNSMSDSKICEYFEKLNSTPEKSNDAPIETYEPDYWRNICRMQKKQTEKGIKTYGQSLEANTSMTIFDRLEYLEEELIDGLMYIEHIKEKLYQFRDLLNEEAK